MQDKITKVFKAIADPTRRELFHALVIAASAMPITQLSAQFDISRQGVTKHLKVLNDAGLISIETMGRERYCTASPRELQEIQRWLQFYEQFWDDSLDKLGAFLNNTSS
jgi:DNA-binding transcriptional ArsR family regulator